jgi:CMP-N,N'-diacetyllegionaminic acid synthase
VKVLGLVTARGGSKGIPGKNLKPLAGKPLLLYTLDAAKVAGVFDRIVITTDDHAIAEYARAHGCEVPFLRPKELARDETPHLPVVQHAVRWLQEEQGYAPDAVMVLQPTSPLRRPEDIRESVRLLEASDADSVLGVSEVSAHAHPMRMLRIGADGTAVLFVNGRPVRERINRRQDLPPAWLMNGAIYICRTSVLTASEPSLYGNRTVALRMPAPYGLSIDDLEDWEAAERALGSTVSIGGTKA